ncbi:hypothetical protein BHU09_04945 [Tannerella sp. oral taxon 808]|nr:hypothetical protein BHU09_04945 [Tannerella sp. oral taxon 808]
MKRRLHSPWPSLLLLSATLLLGVATACSKEEDDSADRWRAANEAAFAAIKSDTTYTELKSLGNEGSIYYKVLRKGAGTKPILYTTVVSVYARGWFVADYPGKTYIKRNTVVQSWTATDGVPLTARVYQFGQRAVNYSAYFSTRGIRTALQYMHEGDRWEVWVPYTLGFGEDEAKIFRYLLPSNYVTTIPAYSTLVFEIEVVRVGS